MEYLTENIFEPLNMTDTGFEYENFSGRNAIPYEWHNNTNIDYPYYNINVTGAGNLRSTIADMANYLISFINRGQHNGIKILKSSSVEYMQTVQITLSGTSTEGFDYEGYGFGWNIYTDNLIGHGGATPGFSANIVFKRSENDNYGMILLFNRGSALVYDENLINNFIPRINSLIFNQAVTFS
jgi:CubicO group peptidase (beta-lactamase class C family)